MGTSDSAVAVAISASKAAHSASSTALEGGWEVELLLLVVAVVAVVDGAASGCVDIGILLFGAEVVGVDIGVDMDMGVPICVSDPMSGERPTGSPLGVDVAEFEPAAGVAGRDGIAISTPCTGVFEARRP